MLLSCCLRARRCAALLPSPNSRSKTTCGLFSIGSGSVGVLPRDGVVVRAAVAGAAVQRRLPRWPARSTAAACPDRCARRAPDRASRRRAPCPSPDARRSGTPPPSARDPRRRPSPCRRPVGCARLLTTLRRSRNFSSGFRISVNSKPAALRRRRPLVHRRAVRDVDAAEAALRRAPRSAPARVRAGTIESSSGSASVTPIAAQERAPRKVLLGDESHVSTPQSGLAGCRSLRARRLLSLFI